MHVMQMTVVKVIDMAVVLHGLVTASGTVGMGVILMSFVDLRHDSFSFLMEVS